MKNEYDLVDAMNEIVVTEDEKGNLISVNQAFCRCFGVTEEEAEGKSIFDFILPQDRKRCNVESVVSPEEPYYRIEGRSKRADGKIIWLQYMGRGFFDENGNTTGFREIAVDITEWKEKIDESARELAKANEWIEKMGSVAEIRARRRIDRKTGKLPALHKFSDICTRNGKMKELISYAKAISASELLHRQFCWLQEIQRMITTLSRTRYHSSTSVKA